MCPEKYICALGNIFVHWETYLCTGKHICALKNIFVHWKTYLCTRKHICPLKNIFVHWETYLCTEKHICAMKIYNCALKNMPVMCSDQYLCTEIFICALRIWATVIRLYFLLITQCEVPFTNKSEATKRSRPKRKRQMYKIMPRAVGVVQACQPHYFIHRTTPAHRSSSNYCIAGFQCRATRNKNK